MFESLIIGIGGVVIMMGFWIGVQALWRKSFSEHVTDEDVLAGRSSCGNCGCSTICKTRANQLTN